MRVIGAVVLAMMVAVACSAAQAPAPKVVDLKAADGTPIKATYFAAAKAGPGVMLFHQCNRERKVWDELAGKMAAAGFHVLTIDERGFGESGGKRFAELSPAEQATYVQSLWPSDIDVAMKYLVSQPGVKKDVLGAGGASCGVNQSIMFAQRHPEVKSLALLSGGTGREGRYFLKKDGKLPLFIAAADDDGGVVENMRWLMAVSGNPGNEFVRYKTGGHGVEMFAPHPELQGKIVAWFEQTLVKTPGQAPKSAAAAELAMNTPALAVLDEPNGPAKAMKMLEEARQKDPKATLFPEAIVNQLAYEHLQAGDLDGAVELTKLNVVAYPESANAYDSLGDAYLAAGDKEMAKQSAEKALALLEKSTDPEPRKKLIRESAEGKLKQVK